MFLRDPAVNKPVYYHSQTYVSTKQFLTHNTQQQFIEHTLKTREYDTCTANLVWEMKRKHKQRIWYNIGSDETDIYEGCCESTG